jgi:hypothetical protein
MVLRSKNHKRKEGHHLPLIAEPTNIERGVAIGFCPSKWPKPTGPKTTKDIEMCH